MDVNRFNKWGIHCFIGVSLNRKKNIMSKLVILFEFGLSIVHRVCELSEKYFVNIKEFGKEFL